jgi:hypothetical protein
MLGPPSTYTDDGAHKIRDLGYDQHVLVIFVENRGRLGATVTNWRLSIGGGTGMYVHPDDPLNPVLPLRLEPHAPHAWAADAATLIATDEAFVPALRGKPMWAHVGAGTQDRRSSNGFLVRNGELVAIGRTRLSAHRLARKLARVRSKLHG